MDSARGRLAPALAWMAQAALLFVIAPTLFVVAKQAQVGVAAAATVVDNAFVFALVLGLMLVASRLPWASRAGTLVAAVAALYYGLLWCLMLYWWWTGHQFDTFFALDASGDVWATLVRTLGTARWLLAAAVLVLFGTWFVLLHTVFERLRALAPGAFGSWRIAVPLALVAVGLWGNRAEQRLVFEEVRNLWQVTRNRAVIAPIFPDTQGYTTGASESVFILQLESGNALALSGELELGTRRYDGEYMPQMRAIARDGVLFPRFWSNSVQSNRAVANILCGVTNDVGRALSYNPEKIVSDCLPELLRRSGYRTLFFVGFSALQFMNYGNFIPALGFEHIYDSRITGAAEGDDEWGVDDCDFYRAMFDVLRREYTPERLLVYAEVSAHHFPFPSRPEYEAVHPFRPPGNFIEKYLNSYAEQDHCLAVFYEEFRRFAGDRAHLIIVPDHSWPVGVHGNTMNEAYAYNENFLVPLVYVPPKARAAEFKVGAWADVQPAHTDLLPTIFELLNGQPYPQSFAFSLRRDARAAAYEPCHVLVQPYGGGEIAIVRGSDKYVYAVAERTLRHYDLVRDPWERDPQVVATDLAYATLRERYYCERYRPAPVRAASEPASAG